MMEKDFILKQRYKIIEEIGQGGFAVTYLAEDLNTNKKCIVKYLSLKQTDRWKSVELFEREAKTLGHIDHPQIPDFIDFITLETEQDSKLYLVQEYIEGNNLSQLVEAGKHFTEKEVLLIALEMAKILEYLHAFSPPLIHRDIKPTNILYISQKEKSKVEGNVYLIDFGAVRDKILRAEWGGSTIIGTFGYMPLEQYEGRAVPATDIYSLGVTLIFLLSHKDPAVMEKKDMRLDFRPHVKISDGLTQILDRMIDIDWKKRYKTAKVLRRILENLIQGKSTKPARKKVSYPTKKRRSPFYFLILPIIIIITIFGPIVCDVFVTKWNKGKLEKERLIKEKDEKYEEAITLFDDAKYEEAINIFIEIGNYRDSIPRMAEAKSLLEEQNRLDNIEQAKFKKYQQALNYIKGKKYTQAISLFRELGKYKDSVKKIGEVQNLIKDDKYKSAIILANEKQYDEAIDVLRELGKYKDSVEKIESIKIRKDTEERFIKELGTLNRNSRHIAISSDGKYIACGNYYLNIWNAETGKKLHTIIAHNNKYVYDLDFLPDGKTLVTVGSKDQTIKFWQPETGKELMKINVDSNVLALAVHPDGEMIVSGNGDNTITFWSVKTGKKIKTFEGHSGYISALTFNSDGTILASGSKDTSIKLWDVSTGKIIMTLNGHWYRVQTIVFSSDEKILYSGSLDDTIRFWSLETGKQIRRIDRLNSVELLRLNRRGNILVVAENDPIIDFLSPQTGERLFSIDNGRNDVYSIIFSPDEKMLISGGLSVRLWKADFD